MIHRAESSWLSVVILTKNEEKNLARCLSSLPSDASLVVVDDQSTDATVAIAENFGCSIYFRKLDDFSKQKNFGVAQCNSEWVLILDADEECSSEFCDFLISLKNTKKPCSGVYFVKRRLVFMGKVLRFGKTSDNPIRLFKKNLGLKFENRIHERLDIGRLKAYPANGTVFHYSYNDLSDYLNRFNSYTSQVALANYEKNKNHVLAINSLRFWWEFVSRFFLRIGFVDGYPGYVFALLSAMYAFVKYEKLRELAR